MNANKTIQPVRLTPELISGLSRELADIENIIKGKRTTVRSMVTITSDGLSGSIFQGGQHINRMADSVEELMRKLGASGSPQMLAQMKREEAFRLVMEAKAIESTL